MGSDGEAGEDRPTELKTTKPEDGLTAAHSGLYFKCKANLVNSPRHAGHFAPHSSCSLVSSSLMVPMKIWLGCG
jgi:hypothetical protein